MSTPPSKDVQIEQQLPITFLSSQQEMSQLDRHIVIDWLADVCVQFECVGETFFLAVRLMDTFLSLRNNTTR